MTIYIYGSESFKNEINDVLKHSNIKFRLDDKGDVKELETLDELKAAIEDNPNNIYLIDDSKIIKKNILTEKIKFLKPKDGIEQEYLLDHGIGDISVDSIDELSKHIIRKLDSINTNEENIEDIQDSIIEIVEDAYGENPNEKKSEDYVIEEINIDEQGDKEEVEEITLDDELSALLSSSKQDDSFFDEEDDGVSDEEALANILSQVEEIEVPESQINSTQGEDKENESSSSPNKVDELLQELEDTHKEELENNKKGIDENNGPEDFEDLQDVLDQIEENSISNEEAEKDEEKPLLDLSFDDNLDNIKDNEQSIDSIEEDSNTQGENMSDDFSEFDTLSESDILTALNSVDNINSSKEKEEVKKVESDNSSNSVDINTANSDDIAKLITQLLNNKTLEITIKVKE